MDARLLGHDSIEVFCLKWKFKIIQVHYVSSKISNRSRNLRWMQAQIFANI